MKLLLRAIPLVFVLVCLVLVGWTAFQQAQKVISAPAQPAKCYEFSPAVIRTAMRFHGTPVAYCRNGHWVFPRGKYQIPLIETYLSLKNKTPSAVANK